MLEEIVLIRHAQSESNIGLKRPHRDGDHTIELSPKGKSQAAALAELISRETLSSAQIYCSPFQRTRQTLQVLLVSHGLGDLPVREEPLLREQDRGYQPEADQHFLRQTHGWFWYRHAGGESPADVYQRMAVFLPGFYRHLHETGKQRAIIMSHGMTIRCFVMRFLNLQVEDFNRMRNPHNGAVIRIASVAAIAEPTFVRSRWAVSGLTLR